jgi:3'-phosphoadenosine 5'-phosphosulfate sulfotransferase (PAPS reductase)/FAD synthetase
LIDFTQLESLSASELVSWAVKTYGTEFGISNSFQKEDMLLVDLASRAGGAFRIFTSIPGGCMKKPTE